MIDLNASHIAVTVNYTQPGNTRESLQITGNLENKTLLMLQLSDAELSVMQLICQAAALLCFMTFHLSVFHCVCTVSLTEQVELLG